MAYVTVQVMISAVASKHKHVVSVGPFSPSHCFMLAAVFFSLPRCGVAVAAYCSVVQTKEAVSEYVIECIEV